MNELENALQEIDTLKSKQLEMQNQIEQLYSALRNCLVAQRDMTNSLNDSIIPTINDLVSHDTVNTRIFSDCDRNMKYEILDLVEKKHHFFQPKFESQEETIRQIVDEKKSLARFGDGEFSIINNVERWTFQNYDDTLAQKLKIVLQSHEPNLLIGIADNYGNLLKYNESSANGIRDYMTPEIRAQHEQLLDLERTYSDAYLTRWYIMHQDLKTDAPGKRLQMLQKIWTNRNVIAVEGYYTRLGVGNDMFDNAQSFRRIIAPPTNSYDRYDDILRECLQVGTPDDLFLLAIGPSSGVLAYDLTLQGLQAVDVGHIDLEYMWYLKKATTRISIPSRYNNEVDPDVVPEQSQILLILLQLLQTSAERLTASYQIDLHGKRAGA